MNQAQTIGLHSGPREEMEQNWVVCRALRAGTRGMREAGPILTPMTARERKVAPDNRDNALYNARLLTSCLHNVYWDTVIELASSPFGRPPTITGTLGPTMQRLVDDADRQGTSLSVFMSSIYQDGIDRGMGMFLVDNVSTVTEEPVVGENGLPQVGPDGKPLMRQTTITEKQRQEADARPYFSRIDPDNFVGATSVTRMGREVCTELRVREWAYVKPAGEHLRDQLVERIRLYTETTVELWQRIYASSSTSVDREMLAGRGDMIGFERIEAPRPHGFPNNEIPLVVFYTRKLGFAHARPPLQDLAHLNVKHWNQQSVLDATLRYCLAPTLFGRGVDHEDREKKPSTGEGSTLMTTSETAELRYVEIAGTSLAVAREEIAKTEERMSRVKADAINRGMATATGEIRADMRENAEAQRWIEAMEWCIWRAFKVAETWGLESLPEDFDVALQRQSTLLQAMSSQHTTALQFDVREGIITHDTYRRERARGGAYGPEFDPEAEAQALEAEKESAQEAQILMMQRTIEDERAAAAAGKPPAEDPDGEKPKAEAAA